MHIAPQQIPTAPQIHSRKYHCCYDGSRHLPVTTWVRGPTIRPPPPNVVAESSGNGLELELVYEVRLFYRRNRACTLYRSWDDFERLRKGVGTWKGLQRVQSEWDVAGLHAFLQEVLRKKKGQKHCAVEYFLRRRMEDCR